MATKYANYREFVINKQEATTRLLTTIQHKLRRVVRNAYTIVDFNYNAETGEISFKKTHAKRKWEIKSIIQYKDDTLLTGKAIVIPVDGEQDKFILKIWVD